MAWYHDYSVEERILEKAQNHYGIKRTNDNNVNQRIILTLSNHILDIWDEYREDTRHYQPSQKKHRFYLSTIDRAKQKIDKSGSNYELCQEVIKDFQKFVEIVVAYRVRRTPRIY